MEKHLRFRVFATLLLVLIGAVSSFGQNADEESLDFLGVKMTKDNGNNLDPERKWVKSGSVTYDADSRTITLNNAIVEVTEENNPTYTSESGGVYPIIGTFRFYSPIDDITIKLVGKNSITTPQTGLVMLTFQDGESVRVNLTGGGSLYLTAQYTGIDHRLIGTLAIDDVNLFIKAGESGIRGGWASRLLIKDSNVSCEGTKLGAIYGHKKFTLEGVECTDPLPDPTATEEDMNDPESGKTVIFTKGGVTNGYGTAWDKVVFRRLDPTGINATSVNVTPTVVAIYDLTGRKIEQMQRGINLVRYSDGTVRKVVK